MNRKTLEILEYDKLIKLLSGCATSELGKVKCASLHPLRNREAILKNLQNTSDAVARVLASKRISFAGNKDLNECFKALSVGARLDISELLTMHSGFLEVDEAGQQRFTHQYFRDYFTARHYVNLLEVFSLCFDS